jgi:hypothetical protein
MAYNLARNSRLFVTTNLSTASGQAVASGGNSAAAGEVLAAGFTANNCWELNILDGFSFSQNTEQTTISINEAGTTPIRGQRAFNTALNPVDISFSTYIRPKYATGAVNADEKVLWNALFGYVGTDGTTYSTGSAITTNTPAVVSAATTLTRATTLTGTVQMTGATITPAPTVGQIYNIKNVAVAGGSNWEGPAKLTAYTAGGTVTFDYLTPPPIAAGTSVGASVAGAKLDQAAWISQPTATGRATAQALVSSALSNRNQLLPIGFVFVVDSTTYVINNAAMDGATIDFGLDAIAMVAWTAKGTELKQLTTNVTGTAGTFSAGLTGTYTAPTTDAGYITNKLSTLTLQSKLYGTDGTVAGTSYGVVLTGGSLQIANNINYVVPNNIGVVNKSIGYFTGARAITGTVNAYLRTGTAGDAGTLLKDIIAGLAAETKYRMQLEIGGSSNPVRVELDMPGTVLGVPSVEVADVVSTAITFSAQGTTKDLATQTYDIENTNDLTVRYFAA